MRALVVISLLLAATANAGDKSADRKASPQRQDPFCKTLTHFLESAEKRFADLEGEVDYKGDDGSVTYVSKTTLPNTKPCIVYHEEAPTGPWVDCDVVETADAASAKKSFDAAVRSVDTCFAKNKWERDAGKRLDGDRQEFVDWEPKPDAAYITVANTRSKDGTKYVVNVSVTVPDED